MDQSRPGRNSRLDFTWDLALLTGVFLVFMGLYVPVLEWEYGDCGCTLPAPTEMTFHLFHWARDYNWSWAVPAVGIILCGWAEQQGIIPPGARLRMGVKTLVAVLICLFMLALALPTFSLTRGWPPTR